MPCSAWPCLGAVVNAKLTGGLAVRLKQIGVPPSFQSLVQHAIATGGESGGAASSAEHSKNAAVSKIATKVIHAAYDAFGSGLHLALCDLGRPLGGGRPGGGPGRAPFRQVNVEL